MPDDFATRLKAIMRHRRVTLKQAADATGKSITAVQKWTSGGDISYEALRKLADFLEVNWIWLRYGEAALNGIEPTIQSDSIVNSFRRKFIADIQDREALLMLALNSTKMAVWQNNLVTGELRMINDEEVFGAKITCVEDVLRILLPEDQRFRNAAFERALQQNALYECDCRIKRPDTGEICWIRVRGKALHDPADRPVRMIGVTFDITELKQVEMAREETQRRLDEAMDAANVGAWEWDIKTGKIWHSHNKGQVLGIGAMPITSVEDFIQYVHPDDRGRVVQAVHGAIEHAVPYTERFRLMGESGAIIEVEDRGTVIRDKHGQPERMVGIIRRTE